MAPKVKITREDIIKVSLDIVRKAGISSLNAREIAKELNCSTQPIFSSFENMTEVNEAVIREAEMLAGEFINKEIENGEFPPYKASGIAYIRFAKEEKELFKLLYMRDRSGDKGSDKSALWSQMTDMVKENLKIGEDEAILFHLEMWTLVHGIATMIATNFLELDFDVISKMMTDQYQGLKKQIEG